MYSYILQYRMRKGERTNNTTQPWCNLAVYVGEDKGKVLNKVVEKKNKLSEINPGNEYQLDIAPIVDIVT
jgi:hypothetical protein